MPAERDPSDPKEWLRRARSNLALAQVGRGEDVLLEDLCFEAQQAAEKAIKGVLIARALHFPKTHVVSELLSLAHAAGVVVPVEVREAGALTPYAVAGRYPVWGEDVSPAEFETALDLAKRVVLWASALIEA